MRRFLVALTLILSGILLYAQPAEKLVKIAVVPNSADWNYQPGSNVVFDVVVTKNGIPLENTEVRYELSHDMMAPFKVGTVTSKTGRVKIDGGSKKTAGFLRCRVFARYEKNEYEGRATAGFTPDKIVPVAGMPPDFEQYWEDAIAKTSKIALNPELRLLPERCSSKSNVYELSIQVNDQAARLYGILCVPKQKDRKYPALLLVPGAGIRPYAGHVAGADAGYITLEIGIHGIPVTYEGKLYQSLANGALANYPVKGWDDKEHVYYKRVYLSCVKAVDYLYSLPEFNGENIVVQGGSQGGALAIVTAALDKRIKGVISFFPALCDLSGYTYGRAGGWPHLFKDADEPECMRSEKVKNSAYFDVVNFARILKTPGFYSFGYNDMVCPPTTMFAAYNVISAPKKLQVVPETAHFAYSEQWDKAWQWWTEMIKK